MQKKLTISIDEQVYHGLHQVIGAGKISKFIEKLVKPHVLVQDLEAAYKEMSEDLLDFLEQEKAVLGGAL